MSLFGAVLGIGAKLFGAKRAEKREDAAIAAQNAYNSPEQIRERAENAGFNPLLFVGPGVGQQVATGGSNYFGSAIADSGLMLADALSKRKEAAQISALESENKELRKKAEAATLRPKVGGIYDRRQAVPTLRQALGVPDENTVSDVAGRDASSVPPDSPVGGSPLRPLVETDPFDPRRKVDNADLKSTPGFMKVDNPHLPFPLYAPTLDGDEALQWYDYPSLAAPFVLGIGAEAGQRYKDRLNRNWKRDLINSYQSKPSLRPYPDMRFDAKRSDGYVFR